MNAFGITSSVDHVRAHGTIICRSALSEIEKVMGETTGSLKRILNLITSQVTHRRHLPVFGPRTHTFVNPGNSF